MILITNKQSENSTLVKVINSYLVITGCVGSCAVCPCARCGPAPAHTHALLPVALGAMNIHNVCNRQTDVRQHHCLMSPPRGHNNNMDAVQSQTLMS